MTNIKAFSKTTKNSSTNATSALHCAIQRRLSEQWQRFGSSFDGPRLDASGPAADAALCNQGQQVFDVHFVGWQPALASCQPQLHAVFEAQLARQHIRQFGGAKHQQPDKVVRKQPDAPLLFDHRWCLADEAIQPQGRLDVAQVEFDVPTLCVQRLQSLRADLLR